MPLSWRPFRIVRRTRCANVRCAEGTHCEMMQVQCVRAPCNPVPECRPDAAAPSSSVGGQSQALGVACGKNTCAADEQCCNSSCGICTKPGQGCFKMFCQDGQLPGGKR